MVKKICSIILAGCVLLLFALPVYAADASSAIGEVVYLRGTVKAQQPDQEKRKLELGSPILAHDQIFTYSRSNVEIQFEDETLFSQGEDAESAIDDFVFSEDENLPEVMFKLNRGIFRLVTGKIVEQNPEGFKMATPLSTIGIRGTQPFAKVTSKEETIGVLDIAENHTVEVASKRSKVSMAKADLMSTISEDGRISPPSSLSDATRQQVMRAAPMTSLGELGAVGNSFKERKSKIEAFGRQIETVKKALPNISEPPDIEHLHQISVFSNAQDNASSEAASGGSSVGGGGGSSGSSDGGSSGGGGSGGSGY